MKIGIDFSKLLEHYESHLENVVERLSVKEQTSLTTEQSKFIRKELINHIDENWTKFLTITKW